MLTKELLKKYKYMEKYGLLHQETSVTPFTLGIMHRGFHQKLHHKYLQTVYFKNSFVSYKNFQVDWYGDLKNFDDLGDRIIDLIYKNKSFSNLILKDTLTKGKEIYRQNEIIDKINLSKLADKELAIWIKKLYLLGNQICDLGQMAVFSDLRHYKLSSLLKNIIKDKLKNIKKAKAVNEYYSTLITSYDDSLSIIEKKEILKLLDTFDNKIKEVIVKNKYSQAIIKLKKYFPKEYKKIIDLHNKYKWVIFGQLGPIKTLQSSLKDYRNIIKRNTVKKDLKNFKEESDLLKNKQLNYSKELKLSTIEKRLFKAARDFSFTKIYRYDVLMFNFYNLDRLLREVVKRSDYTLSELRFMSWEEVYGILLKSNFLNHKEIAQRQHFCVTIIHGKTIEHLTSDKAKLYIKSHIKEEQIKDDIMVVHGSVAFIGRVQGRVKILNSKNDITKVKSGDVIVSIQTNPDLLPAMKKASAFVTDIGGITSHAAIVARELKKPCIIGTKIATKVFKDGDLVDVDATKGDVKKMVNKKGG